MASASGVTAACNKRYLLLSIFALVEIEIGSVETKRSAFHLKCYLGVGAKIGELRETSSP